MDFKDQCGGTLTGLGIDAKEYSRHRFSRLATLYETRAYPTGYLWAEGVCKLEGRAMVCPPDCI